MNANGSSGRDIVAFDPPPSESIVDLVEMYELGWPIEPVLELGRRKIHERRYVVLRVGLDDGAIGTSYCLTRGAPVFDVIEREIGPRLLNLTISGLLGFAAPDASTDGVTIASQRARSMVDICAWDLWAQALALPVWRGLAEFATPMPALLVEGYRQPREGDEAVVARLAGVVAKGIRTLKLAVDADHTATERVLRGLRQAAGHEVELVVDLESDEPSVASAVATAQLLSPHRPAWIEDPFPPSRARDTHELRMKSSSPIGAGDEMTVGQLQDLFDHDAVDVLRLDVTTAGGLSGVLPLVEQAPDVSFHVYPEIHRHLAFAFNAVGGVEMFPKGGRFDFVDRFLHVQGLDADGRGLLYPPEEPGFGISLSLDAAASQVTRSHVMRA